MHVTICQRNLNEGPPLFVSLGRLLRPVCGRTARGFSSDAGQRHVPELTRQSCVCMCTHVLNSCQGMSGGGVKACARSSRLIFEQEAHAECAGALMVSCDVHVASVAAVV